MNIDRLVLAFADGIILLSLVLIHCHSANLLHIAFTGFCPLAKILKAADKHLTKTKKPL